MKGLQTLIYLSLGWAILSDLSAQTTAKIQNTNISLDNDRIIITYDLTGNKPGEKFEVWLRITDADGVLIQGRNFSGDIGKNIEGGEGLVIYWDFEKDQIAISNEISIQVIAEALTKQDISYVKALALSAVLPGWGLARKEDKKLYSLAGIAGYGSLALSFIYAFNSKDIYKDYSNSDLIAERDSYYNDYISHKNMAEIFGWSAAAIWLADIVWMTVKYGQSDKNDHAAASGRISLGCNYCLLSEAPVFSMKIRF
jgi:hypothetical protein